VTTRDPRSEKVAVVSDDDLVERLPALREACYGLMQLPPTALPADVAADALAQLAEQVAEYRRNGYEVVLAGDGAPWRAQLDSALAAVGVEPLPPAPV
jgi:hypothetical protein